MTRPFERLVEALSVLAITLCGVAGFLGLRAMAWKQDHLIGQMIVSGALVSIVVMGSIGLVYVVLGRLLLRLVVIDWLSVRFGALIGALLYGGYHTVAPLTSSEAAVSELQRALQGGLDGVLIGVVLGLTTGFVSGRRLSFDRFGLTRYLMLYFIILIIAGVIVVVDSLIRLPDAALFFVAIPAVIALRVGVGIIDRRVIAAQEHQNHWDAALME